MSLAAPTDNKVAAGGAYDNDVYTYTSASVSVSAFSILGILNVSPILKFSLGVEVMASGEVDISANLSALIEGEKARLDLLDNEHTVTSAWMPAYTHETNISIAAEAQVNPFVELTAEIGVSFLNGKLDLSTGVTARPGLINAFDIKTAFDISNAANVTLPVTTEAQCVNGVLSCTQVHLRS